MKKLLLIISFIFAMASLPTLTYAAYVDCGPTNDPNFCACFTQQTIQGCQNQIVHPTCNGPAIKAYIDQIYNKRFDKVCAAYYPGQAVCIPAITYWYNSCPV